MEDNIISKWIFKYGNEIVRKNTKEKLRKLMKNLHILPTDKPSRLYLFEERLILGDLVTVVFKNSGAVNQNIHITNDEKIKEGDWVKLFVKHIDKEWIHKITKEDLLLYTDFNNEGAKIILTKDTDLIKDGVQAISDEFLEWFVKNPSCEEVEIVYDYFQINQDNPVTRGSTALVQQYKIIIPTEEPKQEYEYESECICDGECREFVNVKCKKLKQQETIEEIYLNKLIDEANKEWSLDRKLAKEVALKFAKWQQERRYSEKEVIKLLETFAPHIRYKYKELPETWVEVVKEWFEQFKKK